MPMNSSERREIRYQRRKQKRLAHKLQLLEVYGHYDQVFTLDHLYKSYQKCCKGVKWKTSVQIFRANGISNVVRLYNELSSGKYKVMDLLNLTYMKEVKSVI